MICHARTTLPSLALAALLIGVGSAASAAIVHQFDWSSGVDGDPWDNPPWNHFFMSGDANSSYAGGAGLIDNIPINLGGLIIDNQVAVQEGLLSTGPGADESLAAVGTGIADVGREELIVLGYFQTLSPQRRLALKYLLAAFAKDG